MRPIPAMLATAALAAATLLAVPSAHARSAPPNVRYVDVVSYLHSDADYEHWDNLLRGLKKNFDDVCGDTFCEGDYSNIESLRYTCSVNRITGRLGSCAWTFAGSNDDVDPATGRITTTVQHWTCATPLVPGTTFEQFIAALQGDDPLESPLPNTTKTIYDGLIDCL